MLGGNERHADRMTRIRQQIERLGLESFIEIRGFVPLAAVKTQLCQSQILLNIRREGIYSRSGLSTKLSEYLASGRLVISSEVGDVSKYLVCNNFSLKLKILLFGFGFVSVLKVARPFFSLEVIQF
jgi:hypothetical protein